MKVTVKYRATGKESIMDKVYADILVTVGKVDIMEEASAPVAAHTMTKHIGASPKNKNLTPKKKGSKGKKSKPSKDQKYDTKKLAPA